MKEGRRKWEEAVARRGDGGGAALAPLPPHQYAMFMECFYFAINNDPNGNLTQGWALVNGTKAPSGAPCGGPAMTYSPLDDNYYILTGGRTVSLYRSQDFVSWEESNPSPFIFPILKCFF
jgi:hypothetical protein